MATQFEYWIMEGLECSLGRDALAKAIRYAIIAPQLSHYQATAGEIQYWHGRAGRANMLAAGEPLPGSGPCVLYRDVNGVGK